MKISLQVGTHESHTIFFSWNQFWGTTLIAVDDHTVYKSGIRLSSPARIVGKDEMATGWKIRVPRALTRDDDDLGQFLPYPLYGDYIDIQLVQRWEVEVGDREQHVVVVEKERERLLAGIRPQKYCVFVDGDLVKRCRGY